jgi:hypothetical protein
MLFVSLTRLRVRSLFYMLPFAWRAFRSVRQTERASGFLGGKALQEARNTFWTMTAWENESAMNAFRTSGAHRAAMPKLLGWCDEASVAHWVQETTELPTWAEAHQRMMKEGRPSKVHHPSADHTANRIAAPKPSRGEGILKPKRTPALQRS